MNELIKIGKSTATGSPVINARDLYDFLEAKQDFSNWLKSRINYCMLKEDLDYARIFFDINGKRIPLAKLSESDNQGFKRVYRIEYALTLNAAKHISMVQRNEKGQQARQYFVDVERKYYELKNKPAVIYTLSEVAKQLKLTDYFGEIGRNTLCDILSYKRILNKKNKPLQKYVKKGYFVENTNKVTEDGLKWLNQMLCVEKTDNADLKALIVDLQKKQDALEEKNGLILQGVATVVETLYFNKGGKRTEEQNRLAIHHLQNFIAEAKRVSPKALKE